MINYPHTYTKLNDEMIIQPPTPADIKRLNDAMIDPSLNELIEKPIVKIMELDELKAKAAHDIWAHWMKYIFSVCENTEGKIDAQIPKELVVRWKRLMNTPFEELTNKEQNSDFEIAREYLKDF